MANDNNYFEFLDIPDGSGGTERWYAKDAEARAAIEQLDPASVIEVSDITALTSTQLDSLVVGSRVNKVTGNEKHGYTVVYKDATKGEISLEYIDAYNSEEVYYEKVEGTWTYIETTIAKLSDIKPYASVQTCEDIISELT